MKKIELNTPFGTWEISEVSENMLKFENMNCSMSFTLECDVNFPICSASQLMAFAKVHNHKFPNVEQLEILRYLYYNGLNDWLLNIKSRFCFRETTYITDEVLETTLYNPYGDDFFFKKYVCYNIEDDDIKALDGVVKVRYMLLH